MTDRLSGIAAFVQAVEAGSFALAAERLNLSASAVGKGVARLEDRLGVRLFHRTTRSLRLTDEGQAFYEHCARALAELDAATAQLDAGRSEPAGRLRIAMPQSFGRVCVLPVLLDLARRHPRLEYELSLSDRRVDLIEAGFDLAIRIGPLEDTPDLQARALGAMDSVLCAAPDYLAAQDTPRSLAELAQHRCVVYGRAGRTTAWTLTDAHGRTHTADLRQCMHVDDMQTVVDSVRAAAGIGQLPRWLVAGELAAGALVELLPGYRGSSRAIHALWPAGRSLPPKMRVVIDALVREVPRRLGFPESA